MSRFLFALLALSLLALPAFAGDAAKTADSDKTVEAPAVPETSMDDLERKLAAGECHLYDANNAATRDEHGVIAGATLLDSYREYDLALLPADKASDLVFYCGSTMCTASDKAAGRAQQAGYSNVSVLREGIKGWKEAGKTAVPVAKTDKKG